MNPPRKSPRPSALGPLALAILLGTPAAGRAAFVVEVASLTAQPGSTGSFDVLLRNDDPSASLRVSSSAVQVALAGAAGVRFTGATIATSATYLYLQPGTTAGGGSPLSFDSFSNTSFTASDSEFGPLGYRLVGPNVVFGLIRVSYSVDASAAVGDRSIGFDLAGTSFADDRANALGFTTRAGTLTVGVSSVPEPASIGLVGLGGVGLVLFGRRPRRFIRLL